MRSPLPLLLLASASCVAEPDSVQLHYGHSFADSGSFGIGDKSAGFDGGDADFVGVSFGYNLKPVRTVDVGSYVRDRCDHEVFIPPPDTRTVDEHGVELRVKQFDALDWTTKVALCVAVCWLGWVYRKQLGKLIPGGK